MRLGIVSASRGDLGFVSRLLMHGHEPVVMPVGHCPKKEFVSLGAEVVPDMEALVQSMVPKQRIIWLALEMTKRRKMLWTMLEEYLVAGDVIVASGFNYTDDNMALAQQFAKKGVEFMDVGLMVESGYTTLVGGSRKAYERVEPVLASLANGGGYLYCGGYGAGQFTKTVFERMEKDMMEAYGNAKAALDSSGFKNGNGADMNFMELMLFRQKYCAGVSCSKLGVQA